MKMSLSDHRLLDLFHKFCKKPTAEVKLKSKAELEEVVRVVSQILEVEQPTDANQKFISQLHIINDVGFTCDDVSLPLLSIRSALRCLFA
eukprot:m.562477 g.562477  ORF g.562477 m.562477 type:complete len:90 (-) comp57804_c0_seq2:24-293(-)